MWLKLGSMFHGGDLDDGCATVATGCRDAGRRVPAGSTSGPKAIKSFTQQSRIAITTAWLGDRRDRLHTFPTSGGAGILLLPTRIAHQSPELYPRLRYLRRPGGRRVFDGHRTRSSTGSSLLSLHCLFLRSCLATVQCLLRLGGRMFERTRGSLQSCSVCRTAVRISVSYST
jgi:hypothetical protein